MENLLFQGRNRKLGTSQLKSNTYYFDGKMEKSVLSRQKSKTWYFTVKIENPLFRWKNEKAVISVSKI